MKRFLLNLLFLIVAIPLSFAQAQSIKVVDAQSNESIPYATIRTATGDNIITNSEGLATLPQSSSGDNDQIAVSHMGYLPQQLTVLQLKSRNYIVKMQAGAVELDNVDVSNVKPDPNKIMAEVNRNLQKHYGAAGKPEKRLIFMRESGMFKAKELEVEVEKSTGFSKKELADFNKEITRYTDMLVKSPTHEFTDKLFHYYTAPPKDKKATESKLDMVKATKLKDDKRSTSVEGMEDIASKMFLKHVDSTKYYRIKSGWFGSRDTVTLRSDYNKKKDKKEKRTVLGNAKRSADNFLRDNNFLTGSRFDFIKDPSIYEYTYEGAKYSNNNDFLYVIAFKPKKSRAKYTGKLYISETDYAVVRADYTLAKGKTAGGINLKLLLGVKASANVSRGTLIFKQSADTEKYYLQYASVQKGQYFYINRPIKFIELAKTEKDVVAFDIKVEGNSTDHTELLTMSESEVSESTFQNVKEDEFKYIRLKRYDSEIWKDYGAIEPLQQMKQFTISED